MVPKDRTWANRVVIVDDMWGLNIQLSKVGHSVAVTARTSSWRELRVGNRWLWRCLKWVAPGKRVTDRRDEAASVILATEILQQVQLKPEVTGWREVTACSAGWNESWQGKGRPGRAYEVKVFFVWYNIKEGAKREQIGRVMWSKWQGREVIFSEALQMDVSRARIAFVKPGRKMLL